MLDSECAVMLFKEFPIFQVRWLIDLANRTGKIAQITAQWRVKIRAIHKSLLGGSVTYGLETLDCTFACDPCG
jgi:hypothetical protein